MPGDALPFARLPRDRVVFFSDAVFAIAMTLLAIEIRVPTHAAVAAQGMAGALVSMLPLFLGYAISFLVTGLFWMGHLRIWERARHVDSGLLWLNILQLMFVALLPFSTGLYVEYVGDGLAFAFYCANLAAIALGGFAVFRGVSRRENLREALGAPAVRWMGTRILIAAAVFLSLIPLSLVSPAAARWGFFSVFVLQRLGDTLHARRSVAA